jgi:hypothetical protein
MDSHKAERGEILITALIVMAVGILLVMPVLHFVSTRQNETRRIEENMGGQYAQDAGIEYAIWKIETDDAFRQMLMHNPGTVYTLPMAGAVNEFTPTIQVVRLEPALWTYSIWVSDTLTINANNTKIYGDIHSNGSIYDNKNGTVIYGDVSYVDFCSNTPAFGHAQQVPPKEMPEPFRIEDFRPGGAWAVRAQAEGKYYQYGSLSVGSSLAPGLHYVTGNVQFTDSNTTMLGITVVAEGTISINQTANKVTFDNPYVPGLLFFSNSTASNAIFIDGNKEAFLEGGLAYAPRGTVEIAGNSLTTSGWFLARSLVVTKNNLTVNNNVIAPSGGIDLGLSEPIYDVRSLTTTGRTTVRLAQEGSTLGIVAWHLD